MPRPRGVSRASGGGVAASGPRTGVGCSLPAPPPDARDTRAVAASHAAQLFMDRATDSAGLRTHRRQRGRRSGGILPAARRIPLVAWSSGRRASRCCRSSRSAAAGRSVPAVTDGGRPGTATSSDAAGDHSVELRPALSRRAASARCLAVFAGGWTLESATRICDDSGDEFATLHLLSRLVDKSLVIVTRQGAGNRATRCSRRCVSMPPSVWPNRTRPRPCGSGTPRRSWRWRNARMTVASRRNCCGRMCSIASTTTCGRRSRGCANRMPASISSWQAHSPGSGTHVPV